MFCISRCRWFEIYLPLGAQNVFGVSFSNEDLDTLRPYLERNLKGYKKMREYDLNMNIEPITKFNIKNQNTLQDSRIDLEKTDLPKKDKDIAYLPVYKLAYLIKNQVLTSERLTKIYLSRLKKYNNSLNVVVTLTDDLALKQAKKADEEIKDIPIIALTAHALEADKERALAAGADDFDTKPVNLSGLLQKIEALLQD